MPQGTQGTSYEARFALHRHLREAVSPGDIVINRLTGEVRTVSDRILLCKVDGAVRLLALARAFNESLNGGSAPLKGSGYKITPTSMN